MVSDRTKINASRKAHKQRIHLLCIFGDRNLEDTIFNKSCREKVLNHAIAVKVSTVLLIISGKKACSVAVD